MENEPEMNDEDHEAFGAMVFRGKQEAAAQPKDPVSSTYVLHHAIARELGVPLGTEALWDATDNIIAALEAAGYKIVSVEVFDDPDCGC